MTEFRCFKCGEEIPTEYDIYFVGKMILCLACAEYYLTAALEE